MLDDDNAVGIIKKPEVWTHIGKFDKQKLKLMLNNIPKTQRDVNLYVILIPEDGLGLYLELNDNEGITVAPLKEVKK